jgi:hypothetical protein
MNVRAMVGATARKCPGNCRWSPRSKSRSRSLGGHEASGLASGWQVTKRTGWRPRSSPRNNSRHVRQRIRAVSGSITGQLPRISRAVSGQHLVWRSANHPRSIK